MTTTTEAIYENGVLRLDEALTLENGARVRVTIQTNGTNGVPANGTKAASTPAEESEPFRVPFDPAARAAMEERCKDFDPEKVKERLRATAALSIDYGEVDDAGVQHDKYLYGWEKDE
jgi:predicted DNA-binding antitoxin AbrB/MazE fold protein